MSAILNSIIGAVSAAVVIAVFRWLGFDFFPKLVFFIKLIGYSILRIFGRKFILLYTDCEGSRTASKKVANNISGKRVKCLVLTNPEQFINYPLFPFLVKSIIILITNVSQLSSDKNKKNKIQLKVAAYCKKGGRLILGHDAIYWRTYNKIFQELAGGEVTSFHTVEGELIRYVKLTDDIDDVNLAKKRFMNNVGAFEQLDDGFALRDKEVLLSGNWADNVKFLYVAKIRHNSLKYKYYPVVTMKTLDKGSVFWVNTGDSRPGNPPFPISSPDPDFLKMLTSFIDW